jgi:hypothetical protein
MKIDYTEFKNNEYESADSGIYSFFYLVLMVWFRRKILKIGFTLNECNMYKTNTDVKHYWIKIYFLYWQYLIRFK